MPAWTGPSDSRFTTFASPYVLTRTFIMAFRSTQQLHLPINTTVRVISSQICMERLCRWKHDIAVNMNQAGLLTSNLELHKRIDGNTALGVDASFSGTGTDWGVV
jgi:hypothetical protein